MVVAIPSLSTKQQSSQNTNVMETRDLLPGGGTDGNMKYSPIGGRTFFFVVLPWMLQCWSDVISISCRLQDKCVVKWFVSGIILCITWIYTWDIIMTYYLKMGVNPITQHNFFVLNTEIVYRKMSYRWKSLWSSWGWKQRINLLSIRKLHLNAITAAVVSEWLFQSL